jgi:myo-inositol-1(or 4)-monophosphatase
VFNPVTDEMFTAERSHGAYLNEKRLRVAARKSLHESVIATGIPFLGRDGHERFLAELAGVMNATAGVRRFGAAALDLAYVAAGRLDGFWERGLMAWDMAAGVLLVREAGGFVSDLEGRPLALDAGHILVANETLHPQLLKLLKASAQATG